MPGISFGKGIAPFERGERSHERAVGIASAHQTGFGVEEITVVQHLLVELADGSSSHGKFRFLHTLGGSLGIQCLGNLKDAPVVIGIFECAGGVFLDVHIIGNIAQTVIVVVS